MIWEDELNYLALDQWTREIPVVAGRGLIVDRNGEVLAGNATSYSVFARANAVKDPDGCSEILSSALGVSYEDIYRKLTDKSRSEISVVRHTEKSVVEKIEGENLDGVYYARDNTRIYPYGDLACQLIGFTSFDQSGTTGVEQYYNKYLAGENGEILFESDLVGVDLQGATAAYIPATDGLNLKLTVDYRIQSAAEETMKKVFEESSAKGARCVVMDPRDGSVLAMVNLPSYDLNDIPRNDMSVLNDESRNRLVSDIYEPGSTFKIVTAAANIEETLKGNQNALSLDHIYPSSRTRTVDSSK
ncbi:MAG: hypothetical protein K2L02_00470, partial [Clostridia bacterium]|nr:hypothetical protein [Clostridia bacterium]